MVLTFHHAQFEQAVREQLQIFHRNITAADALQVSTLDLTNFDFKDEDIETLVLFSHLTSLHINIRQQDTAFWQHFPMLEELHLCCWGAEVDFCAFSPLKNLTYLMVSGGEYSDISFRRLEALIPLKQLSELILHEFGSADLAPLEYMPQLKHFSLLYAHSSKNIAVIGRLTQLESLRLCDLHVEDLDFLDTLPDHVELEMCGIEIHGKKSPDIWKWKRFKSRDISEREIVRGQSRADINLTPLDT